MSGYNEKTTHLITGRSDRQGGRKIDTWQFSRPSIDHRSPRLEVDVHMLTLPGRGMGFKVISKGLPEGDWTDTDLQRLHARTEAALKEQDELHGGVVWEPWLEVQTSFRNDARRYGRQSTGRALEIAYRPLLRGVHPGDPNRILTVNSNGCAVDFPKPLTPETVTQKRTAPLGLGNGAEDIAIELGRSDGRAEGDTYAYLPDTPGNRAALEQIFVSMAALGDRLHDLLSPDNVATAMANIGQSLPGLPLLSEPETPSPPFSATRPARSRRPG